MSNHLRLLTELQKQQIEEAASVLKKGGIVAFPTETVYGLGADATNMQAIRRVYEAKRRPLNHPVIVHLSDVSQLEDWAQDIDAKARTLITHFWPGPLTLILRRTNKALNEITGGQETVAVRMPANKLALALIEAVGHPLIAPSANRFGHLSPTHSDHVKQDLGSLVDFVIEGGHCEVGIESTILDLSSGEPRILRLGSITASQIESVSGMKLSAPETPSKVRVPGDLLQHYAPRAPLFIVTSEHLEAQVKRLRSEDKAVAVLSQKAAMFQEENVFWFQMPLQPNDYMRALYHSLFLADQEKPNVILAEALPSDEAWMAIQDRITRAAYIGNVI